MPKDLPIIRERELTKRLILRPYVFEDYDTWYEASVKRLPKQSPFDWDPSPPEKCEKSDFRKLVLRNNKLAAHDRVYIYGAFLRKGGMAVGAVDIAILIRSDIQLGNLGYFIHNRHWRQGYGKEMAAAALKIGFKQLHLNRLEAAMTPDNVPSIAVAKAIGMQKEGLRKKYLFENGHWVDHLVFSANPENIGLKGRPPQIGLDFLKV